MKRDRRPDRAFLAKAEQEDDLAALVRGVVAVALHDPDAEFALAFCRRLTTHWHANVRGNALQALAQMIRLERSGERAALADAAERGLHDESEYVRSQAEELLAECRAS